MTLSVIIPCLNEALTIGILLEALLKQVSAEDEIIVVDGGSTDQTCKVVRQFEKVKLVEASRQGRALQLNEGADIAKGVLFLFIHADSGLPDQALCALKKKMRDPAYIGGSFQLRFDQNTILYSFLSRLANSNRLIASFGDQGLFLRRDVFLQAGGYREIPIMEDVDMVRRLSRIGKLIKIPPPLTTSTRRFRNNGLVFQLLINFLLLLGFYLGFPPSSLKMFYPDKSSSAR